MNYSYVALLLALGMPAAIARNPAHPSAHPHDTTPASAAGVATLPASVRRGLALAGALQRQAPQIDPRVLNLAVAAVSCAQAHNVATQAERLAVIDFSRSSLKPRLWVFDLARETLLYHEVVAHGQGSGGDIPTKFSNAENSHASSLGLFVTGEAYVGHNGLSMRMKGLEAGVNDAAMARAIVFHGADYVNPVADRRMGRLGRSWGCPALRPAVTKPIIEVMKNGQFVFSYYPDPDWLTHSALLKCKAARAQLAAAHVDLAGEN